MRKRCFGDADAYFIYIVRTEAVFFDHLGQRINNALHRGDTGIKLEPDPHDLKVIAQIAGNFLRLHLIGKYFQKPPLAFDNSRRTREPELRQHCGLDTTARGDTGNHPFNFSSGLIVFHCAAGMHAGNSEGMEYLSIIQAQQPSRRRHRAERSANAMTMKTPLAGRRPNRCKQAIHHVAPNDDSGKKIFAGAALFFTNRQGDRHRGGAEMTAGGKANVVKLTSLTECCIDESRIQCRHFDSIVHDRAFRAAAHIDDIAIGNLVPFQGGTDQLDADLVENTVLGLFNRFRRNIFIAHLSGMSRQGSVMPVAIFITPLHFQY